jgi:hypothetical protein
MIKSRLMGTNQKSSNSGLSGRAQNMHTQKGQDKFAEM